MVSARLDRLEFAPGSRVRLTLPTRHTWPGRRACLSLQPLQCFASATKTTMDIFPIKTSSSDIALSYDDPVPTKEDETASLDTSDNGRPLADRIGHAKVYLLSDASGSKSRAGKVRL